MTGAEQIDEYIARHDDWRGKTLAKVRKAFLAADPGIVEEFKWMGSPVWSCDGLIATGNAHKAKVKITFNHGAKHADPDGLFNGDDKGATRRSIDYFEGDEVDEKALTRLVEIAIAYNRANLKKNMKNGAGAKAAKSRKG